MTSAAQRYQRWDTHQSYLASGWCRNESYSAVLPDLSRPRGGDSAAPRRPLAFTGDKGRPGAAVPRLPMASPHFFETPSSFTPRPVSSLDAFRSTTPAGALTARPSQAEGGSGGASLRFADEQRLLQVANSSDKAAELQQLRLADHHWISAEALLTAASRFHALRELSLRGTWANDRVVATFCAHSPGLQRLDVGDCDLTDLAPVARLHDLREFRAPRCIGAVTPELCAALASSRRLEVLDISSCHQVTSEALESLATSLRNLTRLELADLPELTDNAVMCLCRGNPGITHLSLARNPEAISDNGATRALQALRRLRVLDLSGCPQMQKVLQPLVSGCAFLEELRLACSCGEGRGSRYVDRDVQEVLAKCPALRVLDVAGCETLTDEPLVEGVPHARRLQKLSLSMAPNVSDEAVELLRARFPHVVIERHAKQQSDPTNLTPYLGPPLGEKRAVAKKKAKKKAKGDDEKKGAAEGKKKGKKKK